MAMQFGRLKAGDTQLINKTENDFGPGGSKNCEGGINSEKRKLADISLAIISPNLSGTLKVYFMER